jgi:Type IV secretory pathway, VirD4 components
VREKLKLGGSKDTSALLGLAGSIWACGPYIMGGPLWQTATGVATLFAGMHLSHRLHRWHEGGEHVIKSPVDLPSDLPILKVSHDECPEDAVLLGYLTDSGEPLWLPTIGEGYRKENPPNDHLLIMGMSGVGKTVAASGMMNQQIGNGGGVIFADGKIDSDNITLLWQMLRWWGREDDLVVINPGDPSFSSKYNPILFGDADEVASRIMSTVPAAGNSAGADYYRKSATQALSAIIAALQRGGYAYTPADLSLLLLSPSELDKLPNLPGIRGTEEGRVAALFINRFRVPNKAGGTMIDVQKVKDLFGGIGGRLGLMGSGKFGEVANTTRPDVNLYECILQNKVVYLPLPTMGKEETASDFAKMFIGDYRTAVSWIQTLPKRMRPNPSTLVFLDEPGSYLSESWDRLFEQARSARQRLILSPQTKANLDSVSETLFDKVAGNCATKVLFQIGAQDTAEFGADLIGMKLGVLKTLSESSSDSASEASTDVVGSGAAGAGAGTTEGERQQEMYKVTPDDLKSLEKGECVVSWGGKQFFHVKVPMTTYSEEFKAWAGKPRLYVPENPKRPRPYRSDYGIFERLESVIKADQEYIQAQNPTKKEAKKEGGDKRQSKDWDRAS